ncbi:MAG: copper resistance protein CopC [Dehalococcoidia bacterium]|nr:MAG: copper resistance protein CopC [Dehalococcoidia bacterium]
MNFIRIAGATAASAVAALALLTTAWGHAHPDTMTPARGAVLQTSPAKVDIVFVEEIQKTAGSYGIDVALDGGSSVTDGAATIDPADAAHLSVALRPDLASGRYVVNWHNVSSVDGDAAEGAYSFYLKVQPTAADLAQDAELEMVGQEPMETPTAMAGEPTVTAPAPATSPAPSGGAAPSAALPRTGDGASARSGRGWGFLIVGTAAGALAVIGASAAFTMRRER